MLRPNSSLVSGPFPKPVPQGVQAWLLAETPHQPPISRDSLFSHRAGAILSGFSRSRFGRKAQARPQSGLGRSVAPGR